VAQKFVKSENIAEGGERNAGVRGGEGIMQHEGTKSTVPEIIDPVFAKTSPKRSFCITENERFRLVFVKTGSINSGTGDLSLKFLHRHRRPICRHCQRNRCHRFVVPVSTTPVKTSRVTRAIRGSYE
jgi:hypothetical protein